MWPYMWILYEQGSKQYQVMMAKGKPEILLHVLYSLIIFNPRIDTLQDQ